MKSLAQVVRSRLAAAKDIDGQTLSTWRLKPLASEEIQQALFFSMLNEV